MTTQNPNYNRVNTIVEKCFDRLYNTITFIMSYYAIFTEVMGTTKPEPKIIEAAFYVFLPIGTYVIGLLYTYNMFSVARATLYLIQNEDEDGWNHFCHKKNKSRLILPYGTAFVFFLLLPILDYYIGLWMGYHTVETWQWVMFGLFYIIYFIFMGVILANTFLLGKEMYNLPRDVKIGKIEAKNDPVDDKLIEWLRKNPEIARQLRLRGGLD